MCSLTILDQRGYARFRLKGRFFNRKPLFYSGKRNSPGLFVGLERSDDREILERRRVALHRAAIPIQPMGFVFL